MEINDERTFTCRVPMNSARTDYEDFKGTSSTVRCPVQTSSLNNRRRLSTKYIDGTEIFGIYHRSYWPADRFPTNKRIRKSRQSSERKLV